MRLHLRLRLCGGGCGSVEGLDDDVDDALDVAVGHAEPERQAEERRVHAVRLRQRAGAPRVRRARVLDAIGRAASRQGKARQDKEGMREQTCSSQ